MDEEALSVPVRRDSTGIEPLQGVLLHSPAGLLDELQDIPLADGLLDPPSKDGGGAARLPRLVGDVDRDVSETKLLLVREGEDHPPGEPLSLVGDDGVEAAICAAGLGEEGLDPGPVVASTRLDVGELADDAADAAHATLARRAL